MTGDTAAQSGAPPPPPASRTSHAGEPSGKSAAAPKPTPVCRLGAAAGGESSMAPHGICVPSPTSTSLGDQTRTQCLSPQTDAPPVHTLTPQTLRTPAPQAPPTPLHTRLSADSSELSPCRIAHRPSAHTLHPTGYCTARTTQDAPRTARSQRSQGRPGSGLAPAPARTASRPLTRRAPPASKIAIRQALPRGTTTRPSRSEIVKPTAHTDRTTHHTQPPSPPKPQYLPM